METLISAPLAFRDPPPQAGDDEAIAFLSATDAGLASVVMGLLDQSDDCVKVLSPEGALTYMSCNGRKAMQVDDFEAIRGRNWWELWPSGDEATVRNAVLTAAKGHTARFEALCPTAAGEARWWDVSVSPIRDGEGEVTALLSTSRDVTARRQAQQSLEAVAHEMRHRLRNAYAVSAALTHMSARDAPEHREFARGLEERFQTLAVAQGQLLDTAGGLESLPQLVTALLGGYGLNQGIVSVGTLPEVGLSEAAVRAVALALGELCTNSLKYGALRLGGSISLTGELRGRSVVLDWHERSDGEPPAGGQGSSGGGSGYSIVRKMLQAHGGDFDVRRRPGEVDVTIALDVNS